jgi:hypothetical protein
MNKIYKVGHMNGGAFESFNQFYSAVAETPVLCRSLVTMAWKVLGLWTQADASRYGG